MATRNKSQVVDQFNTFHISLTAGPLEWTEKGFYSYHLTLESQQLNNSTFWLVRAKTLVEEYDH